jgi:hypothetical protein
VVPIVCQETHHAARYSRLGHSERFSPRHHPKVGCTLTGFGTQEWRIHLLFRINTVACPPLYLSNPESLESELVVHPSSLPEFPELPSSFPVPDRSTRSAIPPTTVPRRLRRSPRPLHPTTTTCRSTPHFAFERSVLVFAQASDKRTSGSTTTPPQAYLRASSSLAAHLHTLHHHFFLPSNLCCASACPHTYKHPIRSHTDTPTTMHGSHYEPRQSMMDAVRMAVSGGRSCCGRGRGSDLGQGMSLGLCPWSRHGTGPLPWLRHGTGLPRFFG